MERQQNSIFGNIDWLIVFLYLTMVIMGWCNIYAATYNEDFQSIFETSQKYGKQMIFIAGALVIAIIILIMDAEFYTTFAYPIYGFFMFLLVLVLFVGTNISGSKSWFRFGEFGIQPAEFAKFATNLVIAKYLSNQNIKANDLTKKLYAVFFILLPIALIIAENETGCALVFFSLVLVLYREGLPGQIPLLGVMTVLLFVLALLIQKFLLISIMGGIALLAFLLIRKNWKNFLIILGTFLIASMIIFAADYGYNHLKPHQKTRIDVLLGKQIDNKKEGYNVNQSLIAIGSGGLLGKGFLEGTQTKYKFVPEQETDFIFCTVGEEWGFMGTLTVIGLMLGLIIRIIFISERQRTTFGRIYGYGVASIIFFHFMVNIGMTIGLMPVIGIPLPFFSYGGSSLIGFTVLLFVFLKLDSHRLHILR